MAKDSKVSPTLNPYISQDGSSDDDDEEDDSLASIHKKGEIVYHALRNNKNACSNFFEIMTIAIESTKVIDEHEVTIEKMLDHAVDYANEIADLSHADRKSVV